MWYIEGMRKGFTIIELMVVVVIIGILTAIAIPNFIKMVDKAKTASLIANMHTAQVAAELFASDRSMLEYPPNVNSLKPNLPNNFVNPFNKLDTAIADRPANIVGAVEYHTTAPYNCYTITGIGKDTNGIYLTLTPSNILY